MVSSALRSSLNAVFMMSCVVYARSALKSAWKMAMKRIVVPMPRYISPKKNEPKKPMINLDDFLKKLRLRWLERVVYTRVENKFCA
ncbi:hypothetical protein ABFA07_020492 [Porites harrisoni]